MINIFGGFSLFLKNFKYVLLQNLVRAIVTIKRSNYYSPLTQPDVIRKTQPHLFASRTFKPKNHAAKSSQQSLVIMVHGGGFIMNLPAADDVLARFIADECHCVVTSIDYRKAPLHPFPAGYEDIVDGILALLEESEKDATIDTSKVILLGSSAGGNLVLGAAQDPQLRGKIHGIVAVYPVADLVMSKDAKLASRPDPSMPDFVGEGYTDVLDIYAGSRDTKVLQDVRLSPTFFKSRDHLPKSILVTGAEHDMFCEEARVLAEKLAGESESRNRQSRDAWLVDDVQWHMVKGQRHAFDRFPQKEPEIEAKRVEAKDKMYNEIAQWIIRHS